MAENLQKYRGMLLINKHRLDDELEVQSDIMMRISDEVTLRNSRALEAKDELARVEARLTEEIKEDADKATKDQVEAKVRRHRDRVRAWEKFQGARAEYEEACALLECWRQRGFSIKALGDLYAHQYFSVKSTYGNARTEDQDAWRDRERRRQRVDREELSAAQAPPPTLRRRVSS